MDAQDIFRLDPHDDSDTCPGQDGDGVTIFAVPLSSPSANDPSNPPKTLPGIPVHTATLTLGSGPGAPVSLKGQNGSQKLGVAWAKPMDARARSTYTVYWDTGVGSDASCSSSLLQEGEVAPEEAVADGLLFATTTLGTSSSLDDLDSRDIRFGDYVAVGVVQRSSTGSVGPLSEVLCLQRVETVTLLPEPPAEPEDSGRCSVRSGAASGAGHDLGALVFAGAWLLLRRAQRARVRRKR